VADPGEPVVLLLLPRTLEEFILRDQAEDLLKAPGVVALEPGRVRYGVFGRLSRPLGAFLARGTARRMRLPGEPKAVVVFHPFQYPLARAIIARHPGCELWYSRWDRYERAYDAGPRLRERLEELHAEAADRAALTFAVSPRLAELEREAGRDAVLVPSSADRFPAPDPSATIVAVSLGHLGRRTDWGILRAVGEAMPELVVLLVGEWHADESGSDPDFQACRALPNLVWLGARSDEEAARLIQCADVGLAPFEASEFNDAGLPNRILKYARQGRRTVAPELEGVRVWDRAVTRATDPAGWVEAIRAAAGARTHPDLELREWALAQTARRTNAPLFERMEELGVATGRLGSERTR
jgi:glycosyltransferase involved in cell wall biosynthesis